MNEKKFPKLVPCDICGALFTQYAQLFTHLKARHTKNAQYTCEFCRKVFSCFDFEKHKLEAQHGKDDNNLNECPNCDLVIWSQNCFEAHIQSCLEDEVPNKNECSNCGRVINHNKRFEAHVQNCEKDKLTCNMCNIRFSCKSAIHNHMNVKHLRANKYKCAKCPARYKDMGTLKRHLNAVHIKGAKSTKCKYCGGFYKKVIAHILWQHKDRLKASIKECVCRCGRKYRYVSSYVAHIKKKHIIKCPECSCRLLEWQFINHIKTFHKLWPITVNYRLIYKAMCNLKKNKEKKHLKEDKNVSETPNETRMKDLACNQEIKLEIKSEDNNIKNHVKETCKIKTEEIENCEVEMPKQDDNRNDYDVNNLQNSSETSAKKMKEIFLDMPTLDDSNSQIVEDPNKDILKKTFNSNFNLINNNIPEKTKTSFKNLVKNSNKGELRKNYNPNFNLVSKSIPENGKASFNNNNSEYNCSDPYNEIINETSLLADNPSVIDTVLTGYQGVFAKHFEIQESNIPHVNFVVDQEIHSNNKEEDQYNCIPSNNSINELTVTLLRSIEKQGEKTKSNLNDTENLLELCLSIPSEENNNFDADQGLITPNIKIKTKDKQNSHSTIFKEDIFESSFPKSDFCGLEFIDTETNVLNNVQDDFCHMRNHQDAINPFSTVNIDYISDNGCNESNTKSFEDVSENAAKNVTIEGGENLLQKSYETFDINEFQLSIGNSNIPENIAYSTENVSMDIESALLISSDTDPVNPTTMSSVHTENRIMSNETENIWDDFIPVDNGALNANNSINQTQIDSDGNSVDIDALLFDAPIKICLPNATKANKQTDLDMFSLDFIDNDNEINKSETVNINADTVLITSDKTNNINMPPLQSSSNKTTENILLSNYMLIDDTDELIAEINDDIPTESETEILLKEKIEQIFDPVREDDNSLDVITPTGQDLLEMNDKILLENNDDSKIGVRESFFDISSQSKSEATFKSGCGFSNISDSVLSLNDIDTGDLLLKNINGQEVNCSLEDRKDEVSKLTCKHCEASFINQQDLKKHLKTHAAERVITCAICSTSFESKESHTWHMKRRHNIMYIDAVSKDKAKTNEESPLEKTHKQQPEEQHPCEKCGTNFAHIKAYHAHKFACWHNHRRCKTCSSEFTTKKYIQHLVHCNPGALIKPHPHTRRPRKRK